MSGEAIRFAGIAPGATRLNRYATSGALEANAVTLTASADAAHAGPGILRVTEEAKAARANVVANVSWKATSCTEAGRAPRRTIPAAPTTLSTETRLPRTFPAM